MAWAKVCKPLERGGLGLRSISTLNEAFNMKLCWDLLNSSGNWALLLKARVLREGTLIKYQIASSILSNIKSEMNCVTSNTRIILGNGYNKKFWLDSWCDPPLVNIIQDHGDINNHILVSDFLHNGS